MIFVREPTEMPPQSAFDSSSTDISRDEKTPVPTGSVVFARRLSATEAP